MTPQATDRGNLLRIAAATLEVLDSGRFAERLARTAGVEEAAGGSSVPRDIVVNALVSALDWAAMESSAGAPEPVLEGLKAPSTSPIPYVPSNQVLSLIQSAYDEYLEQQGEALAEAPFDPSDPGWISVAWEKLKALFRGKRKFIKHISPSSFRHELPAGAVVALFSDWGTGEATAQRVMEQIKRAAPTHAIHLGDVYYSGTEREIKKRFLEVIDRHGPAADQCRYFALNSNHEMYSGGFGYFDTTLRAFDQEASYFNLGNANWQLLGLDSGYEDHGLQDPQKEWLEAQLLSPGKKILLTHHQLFSPYEERADGKRLGRKVMPLLGRVHGWFWGHEHKCIVFKEHLGIKARCIGHGAIPFGVPFTDPSHAVPIERVDERSVPDSDGRGIHGFALLRFVSDRIEVSYIDEFGSEFFSELL
jgi:hypothetical protein